MTRYLVILAALLIGSVVGPQPPVYDYYGEESCILPGDHNPAVDEEDQCIPSYQQLKPQLAVKNWKDVIVENAMNCELELCHDNCDCGDSSCDSKCYLGCQIFEQTMVQFTEDADEFEKAYCATMQLNWLNGVFNCPTGDNCGVCSERWCAEMTVTEGINRPSPGQCERRQQTSYSVANAEIDITCTKSIRQNCNNLLQYDPSCATDCGFPVECGCGKNKTYIPFMGTSDFEDPEFCDASSGHFTLKKGACDTQLKPTCGDSDYGQLGADARILRFEVVRLPQILCDTTCGPQQNRYQWGHCMLPEHDPEGGCFAVVDSFGMDIGSCELDSAGATVYDCNGNDLCCPEPEEYVPEYKPPTKPAYKPTPAPAYKPEPKYDPKDEDDYDVAYDTATLADSASTYTVLSVAGIALAHAML